MGHHCQKNYNIDYVNRYNLNKAINSIDIGIFYLNENFSVKASFPTKIAELLSCNKPIICNAFNKDIEKIIKSNNLGIISNFDSLNINEFYNSIEKIIFNNNLRKYCRSYATKYLSLQIGTATYDNIYKNYK